MSSLLPELRTQLYPTVCQIGDVEDTTNCPRNTSRSQLCIITSSYLFVPRRTFMNTQNRRTQRESLTNRNQSLTHSSPDASPLRLEYIRTPFTRGSTNRCTQQQLTFRWHKRISNVCRPTCLATGCVTQVEETSGESTRMFIVSLMNGKRIQLLRADCRE